MLVVGGSSVAEHFCNNRETLGASPSNAVNKNAQGERKNNKQEMLMGG